LPDGIVVRWEGDTLSILPASPSVAEPPLQIPVTVPGITTLPTGVLECTDIVDLDGTELRRWIAVCGPQHALCDVRALGSTLRAGYRRPGERMRPLRLHGSKKLQDLFVDRHIP